MGLLHAKEREFCNCSATTKKTLPLVAAHLTSAKGIRCKWSPSQMSLGDQLILKTAIAQMPWFQMVKGFTGEKTTPWIVPQNEPAASVVVGAVVWQNRITEPTFFTNCNFWQSSRAALCRLHCHNQDLISSHNLQNSDVHLPSTVQAWSLLRQSNLLPHSPCPCLIRMFLSPPFFEQTWSGIPSSWMLPKEGNTRNNVDDFAKIQYYYFSILPL